MGTRGRDPDEAPLADHIYASLEGWLTDHEDDVLERLGLARTFTPKRED